MAVPTPSPSRARDPEALFHAAIEGDRAATGRLLSLVERGGEAARAVGRLVFGPSAATERVVGITGAPGAGKSTLTDRLIGTVRARGQSVGVLAVDPSSPFSGGAILGDRVRMQNHATDPGVFIRSMATRGHLGGLALAAPEAVRVLGAVGLPVVLIETVGVGQVEVEVASNADTTIVVVNPGWGDAVQANKAGLMEIADIFVINKADRPGAAEARRDLESMLDMNMDMGDWRPPVVATVAQKGDGVAEVWEAVDAHIAHLGATGELERRRRRRLEDEVAAVVLRMLELDVRALAGGQRWQEAMDRVWARACDPYGAARSLTGALEGDGGGRCVQTT